MRIRIARAVNISIRLLTENLNASRKFQCGGRDLNPIILNRYFKPEPLSLLVQCEKFKRDKSRIPGYQQTFVSSLPLLLCVSRLYSPLYLYDQHRNWELRCMKFFLITSQKETSALASHFSSTHTNHIVDGFYGEITMCLLPFLNSRSNRGCTKDLRKKLLT